MIYNEFGNILKRMRQERHLTQTEFGNLVGLSKAVISKYENAMSYPPYDTLITIAKAFKVSTDYLLGVERSQAIDTTGLTNLQIEIIVSIANEYRKANDLSRVNG